MRAREILKIRKNKKLLKLYSDFDLIELKNNLDDYKTLLKSINFKDNVNKNKLKNKNEKKIKKNYNNITKKILN